MPSVVEARLKKLMVCKTLSHVTRLVRGSGAKGLQRCPGKCVVARYLLKSNGRVGVSHFSINLLNRSYRTPKPVSDFIGRFDAGKYPDLIASA